jgi:hypothetical protein
MPRLSRRDIAGCERQPWINPMPRLVSVDTSEIPKQEFVGPENAPERLACDDARLEVEL